MKRKYVIFFLIAAITVWLILFLSSKGILIYGESPKIKQGDKQESINCIYFTGTGLIGTDYWYSPNGILGRTACPRIIDI